MPSRTYEFSAKKKDFPEWYSQIVEAAGLIDKRYAVKGCFVWMGYGYKAMMNIKRIWDELFKKAGIEELYFPLIVPYEYCEQNPSWWEGFQKQGYKLIAGENEAQGIIRPTGEPAMYPMFSQWVRSKSDLPIRIYETVSSFRYETRMTRPLIRDREITVWHEIHTAHATKEEADAEAKLHIRMWDAVWKKLALPTFKVNKPAWECFPGAVGAVEYYSYLKESGKVMENGSVNMLGQAYAKKFNISFKENSSDPDDKLQYAWQVCTGNGARLLAAVIAQHGDDKGLVFPPEIAPVPVVLIPIFTKENKDELCKGAQALYRTLSKAFPGTVIDASDDSVGRKFYDWEIKGVPLRVEYGPNDKEKQQVVLVRRDTGEKIATPITQLKPAIKKTLRDIQQNLLRRAEQTLKEAIVPASSETELKTTVEAGNIAKVQWDGESASYDAFLALGEGYEGFGTDLKEKGSGTCFISGKPAKSILYVSRSY